MRSEPRSGCAINAAVEVLGDSWSLIVLRDIVFGDRRYFRELLSLNDSLTSLVARASPRPKVTLTGLGIGLHDVKGKASTDTIPNGEGSDLNGSTNGHVVIADRRDDEHETETEEDVPATPKVDKGKGRAIPEPEEPEKVLSPNFVLESDDEDGNIPETVEDERSPTNMCANLFLTLLFF